MPGYCLNCGEVITGVEPGGIHFCKEPIGTNKYIEKPISAFDHQEGGSHYKGFEIQPLEFITRNDLGFAEGCIIKYVCRYPEKNGVEDLKKARHYIDMLIELEENNE